MKDFLTIYGYTPRHFMPSFDAKGTLICQHCGKPMTDSTDKRGNSVASCSDTGCPGYAKEFVLGSFENDPARGRT